MLVYMKDFKTLLIELRERSGFNKTELANRIGVSAPYYMQVESGARKAPTLELCRKIADALRLNKDDADQLVQVAAEERTRPEEREILKGSLKSKDFSPVKLSGHTVKIPVVGLVSAGSVDPFLATNEFIEIDSSLLGDKKVIGIRMMGDCLTDKGIFDKDIVFVCKEEPVRNGDIAVVRVDNEITCKVVRLIPGEPPSILLEAANKNDPWMKIISAKESKIYIIGKVISSFRQHF